MHNVKDHLREERNILLGINIEIDFAYWEYLTYYHYLHQIFIHRDGIIDKKDKSKVKELKIKLPEYEKGAKAFVD